MKGSTRHIRNCRPSDTGKSKMVGRGNGMTPNAHVVELRGLGAQCRPCTTIKKPVMHGSYETAGAPAESSKKQFRIFRLPCAWGRGVESCPILVAS
mgnify:CR=1 FL=1